MLFSLNWINKANQNLICWFEILYPLPKASNIYDSWKFDRRQNHKVEYNNWSGCKYIKITKKVLTDYCMQC